MAEYMSRIFQLIHLSFLIYIWLYDSFISAWHLTVILVCNPGLEDKVQTQ
jgi:hypothetical protein